VYGWAKLNGANQYSFFRHSKARFRKFLTGEITVHLRTLRSI